MTRAVPQHQDGDNEQIVLGLLNSVETDGTRSQRHIAAELGIALGLVNAYLKRCVKKGWVKVNQAPARRYAYYLTPQGFAEKSRLTVDYLSSSFSFFRRAKADCGAVFAAAKERGFKRVVLAGKSDLAEIAVLCAAEAGIEIVAIVDPRADATHFVGLPLVKDYAAVASAFDAAIVTDVSRTQAALQAAVAALGEDRALVPALLGLRRPAGDAP
jgi:DNA-binding MarR family transcriptional regulator